MNKINMIALTAVAICLSPMAAMAIPAPPIPEPSTMVAGAACLIPIGVGIARAMMRKNRK